MEELDTTCESLALLVLLRLVSLTESQRSVNQMHILKSLDLMEKKNL